MSGAGRMEVGLHDFAASCAFHKAGIGLLLCFICPHVEQQ